MYRTKSARLPVAQVDAHFRAEAEEASDEVVGLENAVLVHLGDEGGEGRVRVLSGDGRVIHVHPLSQQVLGLLVQSGRVVELTRLSDARMHHGSRAAVDRAVRGLDSKI